jgi:hypothetical protein
MANDGCDGVDIPYPPNNERIGWFRIHKWRVFSLHRGEEEIVNTEVTISFYLARKC